MNANPTINSNPEDKPKKITMWYLIFAVAFANLATFTLGMCLTWTSPVMPEFEREGVHGPIKQTITHVEAGRIFSMIAVGATTSAFFAGGMASKIGRKSTLMVASCFYIVAYTLMIIAGSIRIIYAGRLFQGFGAGFSMTVVPLYVGEITTNETRAPAGASFMLFMTLGQLFDLVVRPLTNYEIFQKVSLCVPLISLVAYCYMPESPHFLVRKGHIKRALDALQKLHSESIEYAQKEVTIIQDAIDQNDAMKTLNCLDIIKHTGHCRAFVITVGLMAFQQLSGALIIMTNSQTVFRQARSFIDPVICSIMNGAVQVIASFSLQFLVFWYKRRTLLCLSAIGMSVMQFFMGVLFRLEAEDKASHLRWVPIVAIISFQIAYRVGYAPIPFFMVSELCAPNVKATVASSVTLTNWILGFFITKYYPVVDAYGPQFVFFAFAVTNLFAFAFARFVVIETFGLTLTQIQERLNS